MAEKNSCTLNPNPAAKVVQTHYQKLQASTHTPTLSLSLSLDLSQRHCGQNQQKGRENSILPTFLEKNVPLAPFLLPPFHIFREKIKHCPPPPPPLTVKKKGKKSSCTSAPRPLEKRKEKNQAAPPPPSPSTVEKIYRSLIYT